MASMLIADLPAWPAILTGHLAHVGPATPDDVWARWHADPAVAIPLAVVALLYRSGVRDSDTRVRRRLFTAAMGVIAVALLSPIDAAAGSLASAHMVQHLLLASVAAPLLVFARPGPALLRALPRTTTRAFHRLTRSLRLAGPSSPLRRHGSVLVMFTAVFWFWHAPVVYELALRSDIVHAVSHGAYLVAGLLLWRAVRVAGSARGHRSAGAVGLLFAAGLQGTLLAALMTFSAEPWYGSYESTAPAWGIDAMTDQQLAALIMWFPSGLAYLVAALWVLRAWLIEPTNPMAVSACPSTGSPPPTRG